MLADAPTRDRIREAGAEVFGREEFRRTKSLVQRFLEWLADLFGDREPPRPDLPATAQGGSSLGQLLLYLLLVVLVALLVWVVVLAVRGRVRRGRDEEDADPDPLVEEERSASEWRSDADRAEGDGRWKDAVRARYRELVAELVERRVLPDVPGRTTGELRVDLADAAPEVADAFSEACLLFELPWYADAPTGPDEVARLRSLSATVLAGAPARERRRRAELVEVVT